MFLAYEPARPAMVIDSVMPWSMFPPGALVTPLSTYGIGKFQGERILGRYSMLARKHAHERLQGTAVLQVVCADTTDRSGNSG
jgi:hypothetical protein